MDFAFGKMRADKEFTDVTLEFEDGLPLWVHHLSPSKLVRRVDNWRDCVMMKLRLIE